MINMMYLVFIAMLALQISKEVLATLGILSEDMQKSTAELETSIDNAYNIINQNSNQDYYKIPSEELPKLKEITDFVTVEEPSHKHVRKDMDLL